MTTVSPLVGRLIDSETMEKPPEPPKTMVLPSSVIVDG